MHLAATLFLPLVVAVRPSAQQDVDLHHPKSWPKKVLIAKRDVLKSSDCYSCPSCSSSLRRYSSEIDMEEHAYTFVTLVTSVASMAETHNDKYSCTS